MTPKDVHALGPNTISTEMIAKATRILELHYGDFGKTLPFKYIAPIAEILLEVAKESYSLGAFNMEHRRDIICMAEDQGGWPCCGNPAEFFVKKKHRGNGEMTLVYCRKHQDNRFYSPEHMAPIYENAPDAEQAKKEDTEIPG